MEKLILILKKNFVLIIALRRNDLAQYLRLAVGDQARQAERVEAKDSNGIPSFFALRKKKGI